MDEETRSQIDTLKRWIDTLRLAEGFYPGAEGFRIGSTRLFEKLVSRAEHDDEYHLHQRDEGGTESDLTGARSIWGIPLSATAPTAAQVWAYDADLDEWALASSAAPGAHALGGAAHTADTLANLNAKVSDATLDKNTASRPPSGGAGGDLGGTYPNPTVDDGADSTALHDNVANEITAIATKATPVAADELVIEDSAASFVKKAVTFAAFEGALTHDSLVAGTVAAHDTGATGAELDTLTDGSTAGGLHVHVAAEVTDLTTLATDTLWAAAGDLAKGTGNDAADVLSAGAAGTFLRINGGIPYWDAPGIADTNPAIVDATDGAPNDDEYARWTATGLEGRTEAQLKSDFNLEDADINTLAVAAVATADPYIKNDANDTSDSTITAAGFTTTGIAALQLVAIDSEPGNDTASGMTVEFQAGEQVDYGEFVYMEADGMVNLTDADAIATSLCLAVCVESGNVANEATGTFLLHGFIEHEFNFGATVGDLVYLDTTTPGAHTLTRPSGENDCIVIVGIVMAADLLYFNPSFQAIVEHVAT